MKKKYQSDAERQAAYRDRLKARLDSGNLEINKPLLELDILSFFKKVNGFPATPQQEELLMSFLDTDTQNIIIVAARQTGKSLTIATGVVYLSIYHKQDIMLVSAKENWVYDHISTIFNNNQELQQYVAWQGVKGIIPIRGYETIIGSRVHLRGSSEKELMGVPNISLCVIDETELIDDRTMTTATGTLSGKNVKLCLLGTPAYKPCTFNSIGKDPSKYGFKLFTWSELDCHWHSKKELNFKRLTYTPEEWDTQVLGKQSEPSERRLWNPEHINACVKENVFKE
jgi:hypothetical protein